MDLPAEPRRRIDGLVEGVSRSLLADRAAAMSARYRAGTNAGSVASSEVDALAYVAVRAPATYAAVRAVLAEVAVRWPDLAPESVLDVGAGPGTATWAVADTWPSARSFRRLEREPRFIELGQQLSDVGSWDRVDVTADADWPASDVVVLAYVMTELHDVGRVARRAYDATDEVLVVVEPGTPEGFRRLLEVREVLLAARATLLAPCPDPGPCPLAGSAAGSEGWCHFSQRLARSRLHREVKRASAPWEEERYGYLVFTRSSDDRRAGARVLAPPEVSKGEVSLDLCVAGGREPRTVKRSDKAGYAVARKLRWGSGCP